MVPTLCGASSCCDFPAAFGGRRAASGASKSETRLGPPPWATPAGEALGNVIQGGGGSDLPHAPFKGLTFPLASTAGPTHEEAQWGRSGHAAQLSGRQASSPSRGLHLLRLE